MLNLSVNLECSRCASVGVRRRPGVVHRPPSNSRSAAALSLRLDHSGGRGRVAMLARFFRRPKFLDTAIRKPCPYCQQDLIKQARRQLKVGQYIGAIASARCDLEMRLRFLAWESAMAYSKSSPTYHKAEYILDTLRSKQLLSRSTWRRIQRIFRHAESILRGISECNGMRARWLVGEVETANDELEDVLSVFGTIDGGTTFKSQWHVVRCLKPNS